MRSRSDAMSERRVDDLPRVVRLFGRPVAEAGSEAVWHGCHALLLEQLGQVMSDKRGLPRGLGTGACGRSVR